MIMTNLSIKVKSSLAKKIKKLVELFGLVLHFM